MLFLGESLQFIVYLILSFMHTTRLHKYFAVSFYRVDDDEGDDIGDDDSDDDDGDNYDSIAGSWMSVRYLA